jgi:hypothetical protein
MCNPPRGAGPKRGSTPGRRSSQSRLPGSITKRRAIDQARFANPRSAGRWPMWSVSLPLKRRSNAGLLSPLPQAIALQSSGGQVSSRRARR